MTYKTESALINEIKAKLSDMDNDRIYYSMRKMKLRYISPNQLEIMKIMLVLKEFGLSIVTNRLLSEFSKITSLQHLRMCTHILGDKFCLTLLRGKAKDNQARYMLHPIFLQHYMKGETICDQ